MASTWFDEGLAALMQGAVTAGTTDLRCLILDETYSFDRTDKFVSDVSGDELTGSGYSRKELSGEVVAVASNQAQLTINNVTWTGLSPAVAEKAAWIIVYVYNASDEAARLLFAADPNDLTLNGSEVVCKWNNNESTAGVAAYLAAA
jgi:hypothetical protein